MHPLSLPFPPATRVALAALVAFLIAAPVGAGAQAAVRDTSSPPAVAGATPVFGIAESLDAGATHAAIREALRAAAIACGAGVWHDLPWVAPRSRVQQDTRAVLRAAEGPGTIQIAYCRPRQA